MKNFGYFFKEGARSMFSHGFMSFAAIGVTVACLLIMGTFSLVAYNANENLADLQKENAMVAFVDDSLTESKAKALQSDLEKVDNVADCTFVSRQEARDAYVAEYDEDDMYKDLQPEVFRHRYVIHLTDPDKIAETKALVEAVSGIDEVRADEVISNGFITIRNVAGAISIALIAILLMVSLFIISNTIKLTVYSRRLEIYIMKSVGATNLFIRVPFLIEGMILGLIAGGAAYGIIYYLYDKLAGMFSFVGVFGMVSFADVWVVLLVGFLVAGVATGMLGSAISMGRYLKRDGGMADD